MFQEFLYNNNGPLVACTIIAAVLFFGLSGQLLVFRLLPNHIRAANKDATSYMASMVGVVYAVLLAFIAVAVWDQFGQGDEAARREASLTGNIYRDAVLLPAPLGPALAVNMRAYALHVHDKEWPAMAEGAPIGAEGWQILEAANRTIVQEATSDAVTIAMVSEILGRLNDLYDARRDRLAAADDALPGAVWAVVLVGGAISLIFCWLFGSESHLFQLGTTSLVCIAFGLVIYLIVAFDLPFRGTVQVSPKYLEVVLANMDRIQKTW